MSFVLENVMESSLALLCELASSNDEKTKEKIVRDYLNSINIDIHVPDFKSGLEWFNVSSPLSLEKELKGKLVILDFFTYCCINCLHILPKLKEIEQKHPIESGVVVVGVHSAKFDNEKDSSNIVAALQRYGIHHPVVNDADGSMWAALGVPCWPTLLVLNPSGCPVFVAVGESSVCHLALVVDLAAAFYRGCSELSLSPLAAVAPQSHVERSGMLRFPGKVAVAPNVSGTLLLAVADTGNHRVLLCDAASGDVWNVIGGETSGCVDGNFSTAKFSSPQGVAFENDDILYIADTDNHSIRRVELSSQIVSTVASRQSTASEAHPPLSSPWDLCLLPDASGLLIAAAGCHQLWVLFLKDVAWWRNTRMVAGTCVPVAGTGREENRNNLYPHAAAFAQPSGVCVSPLLNSAFVADSESSSVRQVDLKDGRVSAVVGGGRCPTDLFCFGDVDGRQWDVRLQHPLGVAWSTLDKGSLYVVDSYNHKVKVVKPEERSCHTLVGNGVAGDSLEPRAEQFNEPGGLCVSPCGSTLYVADTNNNCIKVIQLRPHEDPSYSIVKLNVKLMSNKDDQDQVVHGKVIVNLSLLGGSVKWTVALQLANGMTFTLGAPQRWVLHLPKEAGWSADASNGEFSSGCVALKVNVPPGEHHYNREVRLIATLFTCDNSYACRRQIVCLALNVEYVENGSNYAECCLNHTIG